MPDRRRLARRLPAAMLAALCVLVAAGCADVPNSGSVHIAKELPAIGDPNTRVLTLPSGPTAGMKPDALVAGFLNAVVDSDGDYSVARSFLVHETPWSTGAGTLVYDGSPQIHRDGIDSVAVVLQRVGEIDNRGRYRVDPGQITQHFDLLRLNGQWRISKPPSGVPLSSNDAQRLLQSVTVYFFNRAQSRLVPEPILVPILVPPNPSSLATTLVHALLNGPSAAISPAVTTAATSGIALVDNVTIDDGHVAEVDLSASAQQLAPAQLQRLSAQIVWALREVGSVRQVELVVNNKPLTAVGVPASQSIHSWSQYSPTVAPESSGALSADGGRIQGIGMTVPASMSGHGLFAPALSADGLSVAVLRGTPASSTLLVGSPFGPLQAPFAASVFTTPTFDPAGDIFTVRGAAPHATIEELTVAHKIHTVVLPASLRRQRISGLAISADGARIAMTVGLPGASALYVGALTADRGRPVVRSVQVVVPASQNVSGVAWASGNEIATTVRTSAHSRAVETTSVDGYQTTLQTMVGLPSSPTQVAAASGEALLVTARGAVWSLSGGRWVRVSTGNDPVYPG